MEKKKTNKYLGNCSVMAIAFLLVGVIGLISAFTSIGMLPASGKITIFVINRVIGKLYPVFLILTGVGLILKKDIIVRIAAIGLIAYFGVTALMKVLNLVLGLGGTYPAEVQHILSIFEVIGALAMVLVCVYFLRNLGKIDMTYPDKKWFIVIILVMIATLPSAITSGMSMINESEGLFIFTVMWSILLNTIVSYAPYLFMGIDKTRCSFASQGKTPVKAIVASIIVFCLAFVLIRVPVSCSSGSSGSSSHTCYVCGKPASQRVGSYWYCSLHASWVHGLSGE